MGRAEPVLDTSPVRISLPYRRPPLHANQRLCWRDKVRNQEDVWTG